MTGKKMKPRVGRPPVPDELRRSITLKIRVTPDEHSLLDSGAASAGEELAAWVREAALKAAKRASGTAAKEG